MKRLILIVSSIVVIVALSLCLYLPSKYVVPILMYHRIDEHSQESKLSVSPESFNKHMEFLHGHSYNVISLDELAALMTGGKEIPKKTVCITFDDGYKNNFTDAYPVLNKYGMPATIFIVTDWVGEEGYLSWKEIEEMTRHGISIGSHSRTHPWLPDFRGEELIEEIMGSKEMIEDRIDREATFFAYPMGGFSGEVKRMVMEAGYRGACATNPGKGTPNDDIYALKRVRISRTSDNLFVFWIESSGFYTFVKEVRDED